MKTISLTPAQTSKFVEMHDFFFPEKKNSKDIIRHWVNITMFPLADKVLVGKSVKEKKENLLDFYWEACLHTNGNKYCDHPIDYLYKTFTLTSYV